MPESRATSSVRPSRPPTPRGADEPDFAFLGSRQSATPLAAPTVREKLGSIGRSVGLYEDQALAAYMDDGQELNTLYMRHADAVLGAKSFRALLVEYFTVDPDPLIERMEFAKYATRGQAKALKFTRLRYAVRLVKALKLENVAALEGIDLVLPASHGKRTVRVMHATADELSAVLRRLRAPVPDDETEAVADEVVGTRRWVKGEASEKPEVTALRATTFSEEGEVAVRVTARGREGALAAARFYAKLARRLR